MVDYLQPRRRHLVAFDVQDVARINRQGFDVVALRGGIVWHVQCKNSFADLARVDSDADAFARHNRSLVSANGRALVKERNREHLLKMKLGVALCSTCWSRASRW